MNTTITELTNQLEVFNGFMHKPLYIVNINSNDGQTTYKVNSLSVINDCNKISLTDTPIKFNQNDVVSIKHHMNDTNSEICYSCNIKLKCKSITIGLCA